MIEAIDLAQLSLIVGLALGMVRLYVALQSSAREKQKQTDEIHTLFKIVSRLEDKINNLEGEVKEARIQSAKDHGDLKVMIASLQTTGCKPAKEK